MIAGVARAGRRVAGAAALAALLCGPAAAQVYRWVDADGRVHFGDRPPPGVKAQQTQKAPPAPPVANDATPGAAAAGVPAPQRRSAAELAKERDAFEAAIAERRILFGMGPDHVRRAIGEPSGRDSRMLPGSVVETWIYRVPGGAEQVTGVEFTDGRVTKYAKADGEAALTPEKVVKDTDEKRAEIAANRCGAYRGNLRRLEDEERRGASAARAADIAREKRYLGTQIAELRCPPP